MTHRDKKPYECNVDSCNKSYCDARSLRRHLENHHNQSPDQISVAIAAVAQNATAIIAAAAASNSASLKPVGLLESTASSAAVTSTSQTSDNGNSQFSTPMYSEPSTPITSPSYSSSNSNQPQHDQAPYFPFNQQTPPSSALNQDLQNTTQVCLIIGRIIFCILLFSLVSLS